jgi:Tfp pilus assembly protein PilV
MRMRPGLQDGFTLVEVMVAVLLLVTTLLGVVAMVDTGNQQSNRTIARDSANNLAREVTERARSVNYSSLAADTNGHPAALTTLPGLTTAGAAGTWTITDRRSGVTYTVRADVCKIDDKTDGVAGRTTGSFCDLSTGGNPGQPGTTAAAIYADLALLGLNVNITLSGSSLTTVCNLLGANPSLTSTLGGTAALIGAGADVRICDSSSSASGSQTTIDPNPDDLTRVTVTLSWTQNSRSESVTQSTLIPNPAGGAAVT